MAQGVPDLNLSDYSLVKPVSGKSKKSTKKAGPVKLGPKAISWLKSLGLDGTVESTFGLGHDDFVRLERAKHAPHLDDLRQQFLDAFTGPAPTAPDRSAYLAPFDQADSALQSQYAGAHQAIEQGLPELQAKLAQIQQATQQLQAVTAKQSQDAATAGTAGAQAANQSIQDRLGALGVNGVPLQARADLQQQAASQAQANRDAFMQRMAQVGAESDAQRQASAATATQGSLGALEAAKLRAQAGISTGRAQAELQFEQAANAANRDAYERRLGAVRGLSDVENEFNPVKILSEEPLDPNTLRVAQTLVQKIEDGQTTPEAAMALLTSDTDTYKAHGVDAKAAARALRNAYIKARARRQKVLKQLQGVS